MKRCGPAGRCLARRLAIACCLFLMPGYALAGPVGVFDHQALHALYLDGELDSVLVALAPFRDGNRTFHREDSLFALKHLGVIYSAKELTQERGAYYLGCLLKSDPNQTLADMEVNTKVAVLFQALRSELPPPARGPGADPTESLDRQRRVDSLARLKQVRDQAEAAALAARKDAVFKSEQAAIWRREARRARWRRAAAGISLVAAGTVFGIVAHASHRDADALYQNYRAGRDVASVESARASTEEKDRATRLFGTFSALSVGIGVCFFLF